MNPVRFLLSAFINVFGITKPEPKAEERAARYVSIMLAAVVIGLAIIFVVLRHAFAF